MATSGKFQLTYNSKPLKKQVLLEALQSQPNCGTYPIVQIYSLKLPMIPHAHRLAEQTFGAKVATSENFLHVQKLKKMFFDSPFSFVLTVKH